LARAEVKDAAAEMAVGLGGRSVPQAATSSALEVKGGWPHAGEMNDWLTVGELARRSGVATSALRFYEDQGLIRSDRSAANHRRFARPVIRRVAFIVFAQRIGLGLEEIGRELAQLPSEAVPSRKDWAKLSRTWSERIGERIRELERLRSGLTECIGCGCLSLDRCRLANPGDRAAAAGPGPRAWGPPPRR
jgi:MerR family transcriptional regulator, redox-sensitive transcriptional activator SoxR